MKSKAVQSIRNASRCRHFTLTGRQCCSLAVDTTSSLCARHAAAQEHSDTVDHSAVLTRFSSGFQTVEGINFALGDLFVLLAQGRISPRRAAVLTYMASLMLRTLPAMHKNPGKYEYRLIGAVVPPSPGPNDDDDEDDLDERADEDDQNHQDAQEANDDPQLVVAEVSRPVTPPAETPLPSTSAGFLDAVEKTCANPSTPSTPSTSCKPDKRQAR